MKLIKSLFKIAALLFLSQSVAIFSIPVFPFKLAEINHLPQLEIGDWVLRAGTATDSQFIMQLSQSHYSHIGMIIQTTPKLLIIHATTDDYLPEKDQVLITPLAHFLSPQLATHYLILRPTFLSISQKQNITKIILKEKGKPFILNNKENPHLYCSTLLANAIKQEYPDFSPKWKTLSTVPFDGDYLFPQAFVDYQNVKIIYRSPN